jgi:hypothetical protein
MQRPRLLSDNGSSYIASDLAKWLGDRKIKHVRGAPYHPMTQGKIKRWHQTLKNRILLENYFLPGYLIAQRSFAAQEPGSRAGAHPQGDRQADRSNPLWCAQQDLLKSVPGIGGVVARTLIAELPDRGSSNTCTSSPSSQGSKDDDQADSTAQNPQLIH